MISNIEYNIEKTKDKFNDDRLKFEISNNDNIHVSFVNSIRRTIEENVESYGLNEFISFSNTTIFNNDIVKQRIMGFPYIFNEMKKYTIENLKIILQVKNDKDYPIQIYAKDFIFFYDEKEVENIISKNVLFLEEIHPGEEINLEYNLKKDKSSTNANLKHTCLNAYHFKTDDKEIERLIKENGLTNKKEINSFRLKNSNIYEKDKFGNPKTYIYELESNGIMSCKETLKIAIKYLIDNINLIEKNCQEKIKQSDKNPNIMVLLLENETHTIGNLFSYYYSLNNKLETCSYQIPHPLDNVLFIKFIFKDIKDANIKETLKIINEENKKLISMYQEFLKSFE